MKKFLIVLLVISLNAFSISYEKIGEWGFGRYQQIAMKGDIVYGISKESGISVIDYSDVNHPVKLGEFSRTDEFHYMLIDGNTGFISANGKIYITDVSSNIPETISILELDADCNRMAILDNRLYVAGGYAGLIVIDVSDPEHPSILGSYLDEENMQDVVDVAVNSNGDIYVIDKEKGLFILKTSDFQSYEQIGRMRAKMYRIKFISDTEIVLSYGQYGVKFYNCENPDSLKYIGGYNEVNFVSDFIVDGDVLYCADNYDGLRILDISSIGTPSLIKLVPTPTICYAIVKRGDYIFSANSAGGIICIDVSDPANASESSFFNDTSYPMDIAIWGNNLLIADFYNGIKSLSLDDITNLQLVDLKRGEDFPSSLTTRDNYIYYADSGSGIGIFKINEDGSLTDVNYLELDGNFLSVETYGNYLLAAGEYGGLYLFDISDRENPQLLDRKYEFQSVVKVRVSDNGLIVVSSGLNGVKICQVEDNQLVEVSSIDTSGYALDSLLIGSHLFVADFYNGLSEYILGEDFSVVNEITILGEKQPESLFVDSHYLYVACGSGGLYVFDINPSPVEQVSYIETYSNAKRVVVKDDIMFVAEGLSGKIDVYRVVDGNTKVYTSPLLDSNRLKFYNSGDKEELVDFVVYKNLKPVQFKRIRLGAFQSLSFPLESGDTLKCISGGERVLIRLIGALKNGDGAGLILSSLSSNRMRGYINPASFYQRVSIENIGKKSGYFRINIFDSNGRVVFSRSVFVEKGCSKSIPFVFRGVYSIEVVGNENFTATIFQRGFLESEFEYLKPVRSEYY